jgi:NADPH2:quinone reductase
MKCWVSNQKLGIGGLSLQEKPRPVLKKGHILVKVSHSALNFSDLLMINDKYQICPARPFIPGQEIVGIIEDIDPSLDYEIGEMIASKVLWGGFAEFVLVRADMAIKVPKKYPPPQAAALPISYTTALIALNYCSALSKKDTVLIHAAAGGVGLASVEVAQSKGANIIASASSSLRLEVAKKHGANHVVNYSNKNWFDEVNEITNGKGADIILDPVGGDIGEHSLRCLAMDGKLLIVGFASGKMQKLAPHRLLLKRASAVGVYWNHDEDKDLLRGTTKELENLILTKQINPLIDKRFEFNELPTALSELNDRKVIGKIVLPI